VFAALTAYAFDDELSSVSRGQVDAHLQECPVCTEELARLASAIRVLRRDPHLQLPLRTRDVASVLGLPGRLEATFAGHVGFVVCAAALFAWLHAVPVVVEVAYDFEHRGTTAVFAATGAFVWMLAGTLGGLWMAVRDIRRGESGVAKGLGVWAAAAMLLCVMLWEILPDHPTVEASFGTWPANLGYLKSVFYAWLVGPLFLFWPFQFVLSMQRELARGRQTAVLRLLSGDAAAVPPRGTLQPPLWALAAVLAGLLVFNYIGVNHLFAALEPDAQANLFRVLVLMRAGAWIALAAACLWWYGYMRTELKRQAAFSSQLIEDGRPS
jgi:hypothetical protein